MSPPISPGPVLRLPDELKPYITLVHATSEAGQATTLPICRPCHLAILPRSLPEHLRKQHQLPTSLRPAIRLFVATLPHLDFSCVAPRPDGSEPVIEIRVVVAYQCKRCSFIRKDASDVRRHVNSVHEVSAAGGYGEVRAQTWFGGRRAVYWRVCGGAEIGEEGGEKVMGGLVVDSLVDVVERGEAGGEKVVKGLKGDSLVDVLNADTLTCRWGLFGKGWGHRQPMDTRAR